MGKWVYLFDQGDPQKRGLLGGKGAGLAGMTQAGLPVPPGFTITTEACNAYVAANDFPEGMWEEAKNAMKTLEKKMGKGFGDPQNPLLVSVRSGAKFSMPGMMDTVLNLGTNGQTLQGLLQQTKNEFFAWDSYRRFIQMFGEIVMGVDKEGFDQVMESVKEEIGVRHDTDLTVAALQKIIKQFKAIIRQKTGQEVPDDVYEQLRMAIKAVFGSWMNKRAVDYRRVNRIPDDLGTAVNVQVMVFGNTGETSATGVAFTRDPGDGSRTVYGEYLINAQGEDVVAGTHTPEPLLDLKESMPRIYDELVDIFDKLEKYYQDMQDTEFTVEKGKLWMLQTRTGKRTGRAALKIAMDMVKEGLITRETAVQRVSPDQLEQLLHPIVDPDADKKVLASGLPASPGAASGKVVFDAYDAEQWAAEGEPVILVRHETTPDDFHGMVAARAILTQRGGRTSHAAVVARGMGKCCIVGCGELDLDYDEKKFTVNGVAVKQGDWITLDGNSGEVLLGEVPTIRPKLGEDYHTLMSWADEFRKLGVRANADTPHDAEAARNFGAEGIGLTRTEHMFFEGDRINAMREMIMAPDKESRAAALAKLEPLQVEDFMGIFEAMDGFPVTIRLLDPPLHEFLPREEELIFEIAELRVQKGLASDQKTIDELAQKIDELEETLHQVERLAEMNPMLGHRGCRLGVAYPEISEMQARAIVTAAVKCKKKGIDVHPEIMVPLVGLVAELKSQEEIIRRVAEEVFEKLGRRVEYSVGTMIELPRAALTADEIAEIAEFFSFGTNDLTQTTLGLSRDDSARFLTSYIQQGILKDDPFQTIDIDGVGQLVEMGVQRGRATRPNLKVGICGEHGGDPRSVVFCHRVGLNYVSCSPFRVPIARLAAAHAALEEKQVAIVDK